jgi:hypothetical protein
MSVSRCNSKWTEEDFRLNFCKRRKLLHSHSTNFQKMVHRKSQVARAFEGIPLSAVFPFPSSLALYHPLNSSSPQKKTNVQVAGRT